MRHRPASNEPRGARPITAWPWASLYTGWVRSGRMVRREDLPLGPGRLSPELSPDCDDARTPFIARFGFALAFDETIRGIAKYGPLLEVGAGTGFLSHVLAQAGADIVATDPGTGDHGFRHDAYRRILPLGAVAAIRRHPGRAVLMSWPSRLVPWAMRAAQEIPVGGILIHVGEGKGGCTGTRGFYAVLGECFEHVERLPLAQFHGLRDTCDVYRRAR